MDLWSEICKVQMRRDRSLQELTNLPNSKSEQIIQIGLVLVEHSCKLVTSSRQTVSPEVYVVINEVKRWLSGENNLEACAQATELLYQSFDLRGDTRMYLGWATYNLGCMIGNKDHKWNLLCGVAGQGINTAGSLKIETILQAQICELRWQCEAVDNFLFAERHAPFDARTLKPRSRLSPIARSQSF